MRVAQIVPAVIFFRDPFAFQKAGNHRRADVELVSGFARVEADSGDAALLRIALEDHAGALELTRVRTLREGRAQIGEVEPDLVLGFSDMQADVARDLIKAGVAVHVFNQRSVEGIYFS